MPEFANDKKVFTLLEVTRSIQRTLTGRYTTAFWVKAEMNKLNFYTHSGHCYPELVEKKDGKVIALIKSILWKDDYTRVNDKFLSVLKEPLKDGIKILFLAKISFDPAHGLSLVILDIDPGYTLGDLEKEKGETISRLKTEGIFDRNKTLPDPVLPQRIAIISVETSKGYADFLRVIDGNPWNYKFFHILFPSILQGERAIGSIIQQLKRIKKIKKHFDVVAIIRGGGGDVGLSSYNNYELAREIALFPVPVITGIGHATNETVVEMISFSNAITPTKIGEYLLQKFHDFSGPVKKAEEKIVDLSKRLLRDERSKFNAEVKLFRSVTENVLGENEHHLKGQSRSLLQHSLFLFKNAKERLSDVKEAIKKRTYYCCSSAKQKHEQIVILLRKDTLHHLNQVTSTLNAVEKNVNNMSPVSVLKRGYSLTLHNGKSVGSILNVKTGDTLETHVHDGVIRSTVQFTEKTNNGNE